MPKLQIILKQFFGAETSYLRVVESKKVDKFCASTKATAYCWGQ